MARSEYSAGMDFQYRDPERVFDQSSMKGMNAGLVHVKIAQCNCRESAPEEKLCKFRSRPCFVLRGAHVKSGCDCFTGMDFQYRDPERGFDRSSVKGVIAKLVRVQDPTNTTALEVAAGGKLYQVIVDTEATAKALLSKGQLRNRVTIVPLNKVSS